MVARLSLLSIFATFLAVATSQKCYDVNGTALDSTYTPCNPSAKHSGCCASGDLCMSNGLCMATSGESVGMIFQSGCTDATGKDVACPQMCPGAADDFDGLKPVTAWQLQTCDYGKYCCRGINDRRSCCNNATAPKVTTTLSATLQLPPPTPSPTSEDVLATSTPSTTALPLDKNTCAKEKRETVIVGSTIGTLFGAIIAALAATILWMYKREKRQRKLKEHYEQQFSQTNAYRKALASSAGSTRGSVSMDGLKYKSNPEA